MARAALFVLIVGVGVAPPPPRGATAAAPAIVLRMAAIAPDGTPWARLLAEFTDDVAAATRGRVRVKWQLGGIAGDEQTTFEAVRKGELAGLAGAIFCQRVAPSLQVLDVAGLAQNDDEAREVLRRLRPRFEDESLATPFRFLALSSGFGHRVLFSRTPLAGLDDLRRHRYFIYDLDHLEREQLSLMGANLVPLPLDQAGRAYDDERVDGFISIPFAAVAWGYAVKAHYFTDLDSMFLPGCLIVSRATFDALDEKAQQALLDAGAHTEARFNEVGRRVHDELFRRAFPRQGLKPAPMSAELRKEFMESARAASARLAPRFFPLSLVREVSTILDETRRRAPPPRAPPREPSRE